MDNTRYVTNEALEMVNLSYKDHFGDWLKDNSDGVECLIKAFSERKGLTLDEDSAKEMLPTFLKCLEEEMANCLDDFEQLVDECTWDTEETVISSYPTEDYEEFDDGNRTDAEIIDLMIEKYESDDYSWLVKIDDDSYLDLNRW